MVLRFLNRDATTRSMVDLSQAPSNHQTQLGEECNSHAIGKFVNKDLLLDTISGSPRPGSRSASRLSRRGSEKRTKIVL